MCTKVWCVQVCRGVERGALDTSHITHSYAPLLGTQVEDPGKETCPGGQGLHVCAPEVAWCGRG